VIPCGLTIADPRPALGPRLFAALQVSKVVGGVDIGHLFTGLEAMMCPRSSVELEVPGPNWTVAMRNEEFASWGGDLGSAAATKVHHEQDLGRPPAPWSRYFETSGTLAGIEDMEGNIDSYVLRAGLSGAACSSTAGTTMPALTGPLSLTLGDYYGGAGTPLGDAHVNRYLCFAQAIGASVSGTRIRNRSTLQTTLGGRIYQFADMFYTLTWHPIPGTRRSGIGSWLLRYCYEIADEFLDFLERKL
jgi:hypothetical protein